MCNKRMIYDVKLTHIFYPFNCAYSDIIIILSFSHFFKSFLQIRFIFIFLFTFFAFCDKIVG